jgi:hypothetical protein
MPHLTDKEYESIEQRMNSAIRKIVFACKHAEDDELEEASDCLQGQCIGPGASRV